MNALQEQQGKEWPQIVAVLIGCISGLIAGIFFSWTSPSVPILISPDHHYHFTLEQCSYLTVIHPACSVCGGFLFSKLMDTMGRKYTLLSMAIPHATSFICIATASNIYVFYLARVFSGLAEACTHTALPTYVGEISTPKVRGSWGNTLTASMYLGYVVMNGIGGFTSIPNTALICTTLPIAFAFGMLYLPESPYYYLMKGQREDARKSLQWFRRLDDVDDELNKMADAMRKQMAEAGTWSDLLTIKSNRRALIACVFLRLAQQCAGHACFSVHTNLIFQTAGGNIPTNLSSIVFTAALATAIFIASFTLDKFGRRGSVLTSLVLCTLILTSEAVFFYLSLQRPEIDTSSVSWFPLLGMMLWVPAYAFALAIVPSLMLGELFAANVKAKALSVLNIGFCLYVGGFSKLFQVLVESCGLYMPFAVFAGCCAVNCFVAYVIVPETKGKTLDEIQEALKGGRKGMLK